MDTKEISLYVFKNGVGPSMDKVNSLLEKIAIGNKALIPEFKIWCNEINLYASSLNGNIKILDHNFDQFHMFKVNVVNIAPIEE